MEQDGRSVEEVREELRNTRGPFRGRGSPVHPVHLAWTAHALERYVAARARSRPSPRKRGCRPLWWSGSWTWRTRRLDVPDPRGARQYEHTLWGRMYASADGTVRDLWLPSLGRAKTSRPGAELGAVAQVMAHGAPTPGAGRGTNPGRGGRHHPTACPGARLRRRVRRWFGGTAARRGTVVRRRSRRGEEAVRG
ncbi:hypothetical protein NKH77_18870 [Streptomyces sp. M19]